MTGYILKIGFVILAGVACQAFPSVEDYLNVDADDADSSEFGRGAGQRKTNCSCGESNKARIVGGKETAVNEFPLIAGIKGTGLDEIFCGGSIIDSWHVLTAAHCTYPFKNDKSFQMLVVLGKHDQTKDENTEVTIEVEQAIEHEDYHPTKYFNDIALLVLREEIKFTQAIGPACLPMEKRDLKMEQVTVIGWGSLGFKKGASMVLMKVNLKVIPLTVCKESFTREIHAENPTQICTKAQKKDSCGGDSGGPVIWLDPDTNRYTLVALVSYGKTKCGTRAPAVNTDVFVHMDWLQEKIQATRPGAQTCAKI